ncbi:Tryptophan aminotransferase-related protein 2 [Hibiscus syriacus]|uniref:Tryptophan aminotransferase-related protein 2 n=1 Tax=Hibiscus syriacus TaxID=106335 RepID=A0A6A3C909_HIBSY|nr:tryptophan aminotransferase-related protein 2-like [Hibiscus syriacus]KAE8723978.1 Tryptophan aminotransferase-related protein 2 [Hibiscus syriacus]
MASLLSVLTVKNLLVLSLALNVSLIFKVLVLHDSQSYSFFIEHDGTKEEALLSTVPSSSSSSSSSSYSLLMDQDRVINLDHGDPTMYESYWQKMGEETTVVIPGWQFMSYFSDATKLCWFLEPEFANQIVRLHNVVGNAVTENRHIIVGTGSTQLYQAALYALSPDTDAEPISVVSAAPYYSSYPLITDCVKSGLYKWGGDARSFSKTGPYIELVTSPNNPDGFARRSVVNGSEGIIIHDLAYYWPQYTPISAAANYDLMLFTVSKSTGHAGMRIGWALVKDEDVARKMTKYIEINTIGVSKDSQLRAAKVLKVISDNSERMNAANSFFEFSYHVMAKRWKQLREAVHESGLFSVPDFPPRLCNFLNVVFEPQPAFAWVKCEGEIEDCESFFRGKKILTRSGTHFGVSPKYVRISMLDRDRNYDTFVERLSRIRS